METREIVWGVNRQEGVIGGWWGWVGYKNTGPPVAEDDSGPAVDEQWEGPIRLLKVRAQLDAWNHARKLRRR